MIELKSFDLAGDMNHANQAFGESTSVRVAFREKYAQGMEFDFSDEKTLSVVGTALLNGKVYLLADEVKEEK